MAQTMKVKKGDVVHVLRGHFFAVRTASFSPDGRWIVTSSQFTAGLWNADTGQLMDTQRPGPAGKAPQLDISRDGRYLVTVRGQNEVDIFRIVTP